MGRKGASFGFPRENSEGRTPARRSVLCGVDRDPSQAVATGPQLTTAQAAAEPEPVRARRALVDKTPAQDFVADAAVRAAVGPSRVDAAPVGAPSGQRTLDAELDRRGLGYTVGDSGARPRGE